MQWTIQIQNFHPVHLQLVSFSASSSPHPHLPVRQVRGSLVHHTNIACIIYRICLVSAIFLLSAPMAAALRTSHQAQRYSCGTCSVSKLTTICRVFSPRGPRALRILWLDHADFEDIRVHDPPDSWIGCCSGESLSWPTITAA